MTKSRVEAFSDGVIAIAITLLVLDIHVPEPGADASLGHRLAVQWPSYAAYVVSFLTIGIIWINHNAMLRRLKAVDHSILFLNLLLLMTVAVLPFTTALMAAYLKASSGEKLAAAIYGGSLLLMAVAFFAMQQHMMRRRVSLLQEHLTPELRDAVIRRNAAGLVPYAVATAAAVITPYLTLAICALVALFYALPGTTGDTPPD
ncbi:MAG: TMEM175 family protein [Gaiellaceae bacterium]